MVGQRALPRLALLLAVASTFACAASPIPRALPSAPPKAVAAPDPASARVPLTGGVGNKVVDSFDQLRVGVGRVQRAIDACYVSTADEGGWRENLLWDLDVSDVGKITRVTPHDAEYWRGGRVVTARPSPGLARCMEGVLRGIIIQPPVRAGWVRLRFEA